MKQTLKKLLFLMLCVVFVVGLLPMTASAKMITQYSQGDIIEFGWYPQTKVTDSTILDQLNAKAPAWDNWISYGYYSGTGSERDGQMKPGDFMRYTDILLDGVKYRGVKFTSYRPRYTGYVSSANYSDQYSNGYFTDTVYWFCFEPLRWRVLDPAAGLVLCETIIDSQPFNNYALHLGADEYNRSAMWGSAEQTYYANNYVESDIRKWLNNNFYSTAFSVAQQAIVPATELDNTAGNSNYPAYGVDTTYDKIFLLSRSDVLNTQYGFASSTSASDTRQAKGSDYAKCQGLNVATNSLYIGCSPWLQRSSGEGSGFICAVNPNGASITGLDTGIVRGGVRPALRFQLTSDIFQSNVADTGVCATHKFSSVVTLPTCTGKGYTTNVCVACGYTYIDKEVDALGHTNETIPGKAATCTATGLTDGVKCSVCGEILVAQEVIPVVNHTKETIPGKAATCTATGLTDGVKCSVCGEILTDQEEIPVVDHTEETIPGKAATCTATGLTDGVKCSVCGEILTAQEVIPVVDHTKETIPGKAATCTATGLTDGVKCSVCGGILTTQKVIPVLDHTKETIPGKAATCTATGLTDGVKCSVCGEILTAQEEIPAEGHTEETISGKAATCTATGLTDGVKCSVCGIVLVEQNTISKTGHTFGGWIVSKEATKTENGIMERICAICGTKEEQLIPKLLSVTIRNYVENRTVDYRTTVTLTAEVTGPIAGGEIHWFVDGKDVGTGESCTVKEAKKTFTVQAKYTDGDKVLAESEVETVKVKTGFFDKLKAFFRALFKKLPVVVQEYVGLEIIDRVLP